MILAIIVMLLLAAPVEAQMYRYVDQNGKVHITDDPNKIPKDNPGGTVDVLRTTPAPDVRSPRRADPPGSDYYEQKVRENREREDRERAARAAAAAWYSAIADCKWAGNSEDYNFEVTSPEYGRVKYFGSAKARWAFEKCMDSKGQVLSGR